MGIFAMTLQNVTIPHAGGQTVSVTMVTDAVILEKMIIKSRNYGKNGVFK